jgi:hypothetical protein
VHAVVTEDYDKLQVDQDVEVYFEKIAEDDDGNELIVDKFRIAK